MPFTAIQSLTICLKDFTNLSVSQKDATLIIYFLFFIYLFFERALDKCFKQKLARSEADNSGVNLFTTIQHFLDTFHFFRR